MRTGEPVGTFFSLSPPLPQTTHFFVFFGDVVSV